MEQINILLCTDKYYVMPCGITIFSICLHNQHNKLHFHLLVEGVSEEQKKEISELIQSHQQEVTFYDVDNTILKDLPVNNRFRISIYYRLMMGKILPSAIKKILYMDSDVIVRGDLHEIWQTELSKNSVIGAVLDQSCDDIRHYNRTELPPMSGYYNSGVLLVNLDVWRKRQIGEQCIHYINQNPNKVLYPDQDALNVVTYKQWDAMSFRYNVQAYMYYCAKDILARNEYVSQMIKESENPLIIHYTEARKPWMEGCKHPFTNEYLKYKHLSPWKDYPLIVKRNVGKIDAAVAAIKKICRIKPTEEYSCYREQQSSTLQPYHNPTL